MWFGRDSLRYNFAAFCEIWNFKQLYAFNVRPTSGPPSVPGDEKIENLNQPYYSQCRKVCVWGFWWIFGEKRLRKRFRPTSGPPSAPTRSKIKIWASSFHGQLEDLSNKPPTSFLGPHLHTPKRPRKKLLVKKKKKKKRIRKQNPPTSIYIDGEANMLSLFVEN